MLRIPCPDWRRLMARPAYMRRVVGFHDAYAGTAIRTQGFVELQAIRNGVITRWSRACFFGEVPLKIGDRVLLCPRPERAAPWVIYKLWSVP